MKLQALILLILSFNHLESQGALSCYEFMSFGQNESFKDTIYFTNGHSLYYDWNCDSTWLTFENETKTHLKTCKDLDPITCSRIGLNYIKEYPDYLLFIEKLVSGCCTPGQVVLVDKKTGKEFVRIENLQIISLDVANNYILYFESLSYESIVYFDLNTGSKKQTELDSGIVQKSLEKYSLQYASELFRNIIFSKEEISLDFKNESGKFENHNIKL